jgi:hypothetical protein
MFDHYAPIDVITTQDWAKSAIERGKSLKIAAEAIEQPWAVEKNPTTGVYTVKTCGDLTIEGFGCLRDARR